MLDQRYQDVPFLFTHVQPFFFVCSRALEVYLLIRVNGEKMNDFQSKRYHCVENGVRAATRICSIVMFTLRRLLLWLRATDHRKTCERNPIRLSTAAAHNNAIKNDTHALQANNINFLVDFKCICYMRAASLSLSLCPLFGWFQLKHMLDIYAADYHTQIMSLVKDFIFWRRGEFCDLPQIKINYLIWINCLISNWDYTWFGIFAIGANFMLILVEFLMVYIQYSAWNRKWNEFAHTSKWTTLAHRSNQFNIHRLGFVVVSAVGSAMPRVETSSSNELDREIVCHNLIWLKCLFLLKLVWAFLRFRYFFLFFSSIPKRLPFKNLFSLSL